MIYNGLIREFTIMCNDYGFAKHGKVYSRCIGDAIYQNISINSLEYLPQNSPEYTPYNKKSPCIKFEMWSMYSDLHIMCFSDRNRIGRFWPENIQGHSFTRDIFLGFENQVEIMRTVGFPLLNSVISQEKLIETMCCLQQAEYGYLLPHQFYLCAPYILCGEEPQALNHLYSLYAQSWLNFHKKHDHLKVEGQTHKYIELELRQEKDLENVSNLLQMVLGNQKVLLNAYFRDCLKRNIELVEKYRIPISNDFAPKLG